MKISFEIEIVGKSEPRQKLWQQGFHSVGIPCSTRVKKKFNAFFSFTSRIKHRHSDLASYIWVAVHAPLRRGLAALLLSVRRARRRVVRPLDVPCLWHAAETSQDMPQGGWIHQLVYWPAGSCVVSFILIFRNMLVYGLIKKVIFVCTNQWQILKTTNIGDKNWADLRP